MHMLRGIHTCLVRRVPQETDLAEFHTLLESFFQVVPWLGGTFMDLSNRMMPCSGTGSESTAVTTTSVGCSLWRAVGGQDSVYMEDNRASLDIVGAGC